MEPSPEHLTSDALKKPMPKIAVSRQRWDALIKIHGEEKVKAQCELKKDPADGR